MMLKGIEVKEYFVSGLARSRSRGSSDGIACFSVWIISVLAGFPLC